MMSDKIFKIFFLIKCYLEGYKTVQLYQVKVKISKQNIFIRILIIAIIQFATATVLPAQNWRGTVNSDWNNSANWSSWPLNNINIVIDPLNYTGNAASPVISVASVFSPKKVIVQNAAELIIQNNLTTNDNFDVTGVGSKLTITGGIFNIGLAANGRLLVDLGAQMIMNGGSIATGRNVALGTGTTITMNNGSLTSGDRLLMDLGGRFILNAGNIIVATRLALADGDLAGSSFFQMNGGTVTVGAEISLGNEFGNYSPGFNLAGGTLTVNGNVLWLGIAPGSGTPKFNISGGTAHINGNIQNSVASTVNLFLEINGTGQLNFNGSLIDALYVADSIKHSGNTQFFINAPCTWTNHGVFHSQNSLVNFNGNASLQGTGVYNFDDILINSNKTVTHVSPVNIDVKGDFMNHGDFISNLNMVTFNGVDVQSIDGSTSTSFYKLKISNSSAQGVIVKKSIFVTGQ